MHRMHRFLPLIGKHGGKVYARGLSVTLNEDRNESSLVSRELRAGCARVTQFSLGFQLIKDIAPSFIAALRV